MTTSNPSPNSPNRKTPGVHITELDAFVQSIVGVATAVPAFIGYTQQAIASGKSVLMQPVAIGSMTDFEQIFGTEYDNIFDILPLSGSPVAGVSPDFTVNGQGYILDTGNRPRFNLYYSMRLFYANGGGNCYVVSVGNYSGAVAAQPLLDGLKAISYQVGPTMLGVPDAVLLPPDPGAGSIPPQTSAAFENVTQAMLTQCENLQDRVAIFDVYDATSVTHANVNQTLEPCIANFRQYIPTQPLPPSYGAAYFPFLKTSVVLPSDINYTNFNPGQRATGATTPDSTNPPVTPPTVYTQLQYILTLFNQEQNPNSVQNGQTIQNPVQQKVQYSIDTINQDYNAPNNSHSSAAVHTLNNSLANALPAYANLLSLAAARVGLLPPSGAMAGIYTLNDQSRGVWNAPANLPVMQTASLTVNLSDTQQGDLNVPIDGKAINVIRYFPGQGPLVWGARTLDGNSQDWRYIQVRRTIVYIQTSISDALNEFVFAPNDASTWVAVTQMISGFLTGLWSDGGLMGDKASDAFTVLCGVPQTMTATDVLNGYMVVQVTLQMIHPAEFIELTFKQTMQGA